MIRRYSLAQITQVAVEIRGLRRSGSAYANCSTAELTEVESADRRIRIHFVAHFHEPGSVAHSSQRIFCDPGRFDESKLPKLDFEIFVCRRGRYISNVKHCGHANLLNIREPR